MDWYSLLIRYGVDVPNTEDEFSIHCPFHDDRRASCAVNVEKGVWNCFAGCGQGGLNSFIWRISGKPWNEIQVEIQETDLDFSIGEFDLGIKTPDEEDTFQPTYEGLVDINDNHWIYQRGFTKEILKTWGCKQNAYGDFVLPVENEESETLGWITRRLELTPKYLFSKGFRKSKALFGLNHLMDKDVIFICEGALDAIWLHQNGYNGLGILGATISKNQIELLKKLKPQEVVLCLDNDEAGKKGTEKATFDLEDWFMISFIQFPKRYKDFQDIRNRIEIDKIIENRNIF
tara:strand:+ start:2747 stop:3613 length:867 start_codon:yes stop_codon:yes gene_type:complete